MSLSKVGEALAIIAAIVTIVWGTLAIINDYVIPHMAILSAIPPYVEWAILGVLFFITAILVIRFYRAKKGQIAQQKKKMTTNDSSLANVDPRLWYIEIYYSDKNDSPDTIEPHRPYYVVNRKSGQAYWVSDLVINHVRRHTFCFYTYNNATKLQEYLRSQDITINERAPSGEELGLRFFLDGSLYVMSEIAPEELQKYEENKRKFQDFKIVLVYTYGYKRIYPPTRRLLVKISSNEAFHPPLHDRDLIDNCIINNEDAKRFSFEPYRIFCWRKGWKYRPWRYPLENEIT